MAQEKPTSIRILQSQKKAGKPTVLLIAAGFTAGVIVSILGFMLFLKSSSNDVNDPTGSESNVVNTVQAESRPTSNTAIPHELNQATVPAQSEPNTEDDEAIKQPKESELSKLFKHTPQSQPQNMGQPSPFGANLMPSAVAPNKNSATTQMKVEQKPKASTERKKDTETAATATTDAVSTDKAEISPTQ